MTRKPRLPSRVSLLALATVMVAGASPAAAQSFQGNGTFTSGTGSVTTPDSVTTNISVTSPQAVIDWTPFADGGISGQDIVFQAGSTFANFSSATDFAVLNRIDPGDMTRMIRMDGTITSKVNGVTGGSVYFYSPSGFVLGATSLIDVGSLVLTSRPITVDGNGNFINNGTVIFGAAPDPFGTPVNPAARIETHPLSQINALNEGSYVAMVAPRVQHHGTISVNGAAALVGAEAATVTFRPSGLFDIQVDVGTDDANGVAVYGDINGPASSGIGDNHRIYLAAVPKNTALTMAIQQGADLGFDVAQSADVVGNTVVLSAGHDVFFGSPTFDPSAASGGAANVNILNANFTSALVAQASGNIDLGASAGQSTHLYSTASLTSSGGYIQVESVGSDALLNIDSDLTLVNDRYGQSNGESVTAGDISVYAQSGGTLIVGGGANISANGYGGDSFTAGVAAGNGTGGRVQVQAEAGSNLSIGSVFATVDGYGGQPGAPGVDAGNGKGGYAFIGTLGNNASLGIASNVTLSTNGYGGAGDGSSNECSGCDGLGGTGTGGDIFLGTSTGTGSTAYYGDFVQLNADGEGGRSAAPGSAAGSGTGGNISVFSSGGSQIEGFGTTFASDLTASATGRGGESSTPGIAAGLGNGGTVKIFATANSTMGILGGLQADASGFGGFNDFGVAGGNGLGELVEVYAEGGDSLISVTGNTNLVADGEGSDANSDCIGCGGVGGNGVGGDVRVRGGAGTNNRLAFGGSLDLNAEGNGGIGGTGLAGNGTGGNATIDLTSGLAVTVGAGLVLEADGYGGYGYNGNGAGAGTGKVAAIYGNGGSLTVTGNSSLDANGTGGNTGIVAGGIGGDGTGGIAAIYAPAGTINLTGNLLVNATGQGGDSAGNVGGNALGGSARVNAAGGTIHVSGNLFLDGGAIGGDGVTGGNATGRISTPPDEAEPIAVALYAQNNGSLDVDGIAVLSGEAVGGNGSNGNGGNAAAGEADVVAYFGSIDLGSLSIDVNGYGGDGGNGGNGGSASGGPVDVAFGLGAAAIGGTITLGSATITADGEGGNGGAGANGTVGGNGGTGGDGTAGRIGFTGSAANGTLDTGLAILTSIGRGGNGGAGGNGSSGVGGNGGAGGIGTGSGIQTGTISADMAPTTGGGASYTTILLDTSGFGGTGGDGGTGAGGNGSGGDGGNAQGGNALFLVRGTLVTADTVTLTANATGGNGGSGAAGGDGGDARTGAVQVESKDRFNHPDQRGTLQADSIVGSAIAVAGTGAVNGVSSVIGNSYFRVLNGDATIGSVNITTSGSVFDNSFVNSTVSVRDGTATITGDFSFTTTGELALDASNGSMTANSINLAAGNFIVDSFSETQVGPQVGPGTYSAGGFSISTGGNFVTNAHLVSGGSLSILAPGAIDMRNASSTDGNLTLDSGSSIVGDNLNAAGSISATAAANITLGNIAAGSSIDVGSFNGAISLDDLAAVTTIRLDAPGAIGFGDVVADDFDFGGGSTVTGGNIVAGTEASGDADGAISLGDISVGILLSGGPSEQGFAVGMSSETSINVGNVEADEGIGFATLGPLTTGILDAGTTVLAMVGGDMSLGAITTPNSGRVYLADVSMFLAAGGPDDFDPSQVLVATPVRSGGSILIGGPVSTGFFQAAAGTTLTTQSIVAPLGIYLDAGGNIITGALTSDDDIDATSDGSIQTGAIASTIGHAFLTATNSVAANAINVGGGVQLTSNTSNITTGNISTPGDIVLGSVTGVSTGNLLSNANINIVNGGSILTGDITSTGGGIFLQSDVDIVTGAINTPFDAEFDALGNISLTGDANAGGYLFADAGGNLAMANATAGESIDVIAGGTILGASMTAGDSVIARAAGAVTLGNLSAGIVNPSSEPLDGQIVAIGSLTSVNVGNIDAANFVGLASDGALDAGTVQSGGDVMVLADGPSTIGAITSNVEGRTYIAGFGMLDVGGGFEDFDPSLVYAAASPIPTAGSITVNGSIVTGRLDAFVGGSMSLGPVIAGTINGRVGGLASIDGLWEAPDVELWSNDIAIGANGGIDAGNFGNIRLVSTNATQALIGDGLSGSGYQLSNAEFGRLNSGSLEIAARGDASAPIDMLIGDLSITGPLVGSTVDDPNGFVAFATGNPLTQQPGGVIRITGEVTATGFEDTNSLEFYTGRFELDAATGSVAITSSGGALSGELGLYADQIHVAEGSILDKLAVDSQYAGYQEDLNAPAAVQRPEGVLNAATIWIESDNLQNVLIQNTGTTETPAGFLAQETFVNDDFEIAGPPGSIDLVVNGQLQTEGGVLTGIAVRDASVEGADLTPFTANSTINGCLLAGACGEGPEPPFPPDFIPTPGIQQEIVLLGDDPLPPPPFGNEAVIDDNDEETDDTSPIVPPQPLFDTSELGEATDSQVNPKFGTPMRSAPGIKQEGDVDDPVSGSGNPALTENPTPTGEQEKQP